MSRSSVLLALTAAGVLGGAAPAFAATAQEEAAVAAMPHSAPVSNGIPVQVGTHRGKPRIAYIGPGSGNLSPGVPHVVGQGPEGDPVITYTPG